MEAEQILEKHLLLMLKRTDESYVSIDEMKQQPEWQATINAMLEYGEMQALRIHDAVGQSEQLKAEDKDLPFADYLEKWYKLPRYEKVYDRKDGKGTNTEDEVIKNYRRAFCL